MKSNKLWSESHIKAHLKKQSTWPEMLIAAAVFLGLAVFWGMYLWELSR